MIGSECLTALHQSNQGICIVNRQLEKIYENEKAKRLFADKGSEFCRQLKNIYRNAGEMISANSNSMIHYSGMVRYLYGAIIFNCFSFGKDDQSFLCIIFDYTSLPETEVVGNIVLTRREKDILRIMAQGKTNKEISEALSIGLETVKSHIRNVFAKTGVRSRVELLRKVFALLPPEREDET